MADIVYTVNQDSPETITGFEQYSQEDKALVPSFQINNTFDPTKHYSELHILSLSDELLESTYNYNSYKLLGNAQSAGQAGASVLTIDPIQDSKAYGYENAGVKLLYHFLDDLYSEDSTTVEFYIQSISPDRTELALSTLNLTPEVVATITSNIKVDLQSQSYFTGFRLDFKNNDLFIATNIDILDTDAGQVVVVKLYEPLPTTYGIKSTLNIVDIVSDSVVYEVDSQIVEVPEVPPTLRSANFNIEIADDSVIPTQYFNYDELFSYPITNANSEIFSTVNEKGIDISVDYTDFNDFVHFSSAQERLLNFKYKLDLVSSYSSSLVSASSATTGLQGISGSVSYYENLITGVVNNFDHYERFLYYESGSNSWPKSNTTKPYINKPSSNSESITWYADQISQAIQYDSTNYNSLIYSIPTYLRDDPSNENYTIFVYMVGQHFDNLWLYSKAVTDKYDGDNRINYGISKDLVAEALKNFGVKLYTSNKSVEDLFTTFIGQAYQSGSEKINTYVTGSLTGSNTPIQPTSYDNYQKEIQKRIYHNLPLLLKSKGTERGLRALINCYGIPGDILDIKLYGGRDTTQLPLFGDLQYTTSSLDKIRLDNTGSLVSGSTLSNYTSIIKRDQKYTDDLHTIEVGFSPTDAVDTYIIQSGSSLVYTGIVATDFINRVLADGGTVENAQALLSIIRQLESLGIASNVENPSLNLSIDQFLGDPGNIYTDKYSGLDLWNSYITQDLSKYDVQDYVRLIKFFDNTIFKTIKDFIPARTTANTGVIIKPNLLNRSKAKSVAVSATQPQYTASIDTAFISGSYGGCFTSGLQEMSTNWKYSVYTATGQTLFEASSETVQTPFGLREIKSHQQEEPRYNGELSGSLVIVSDGELNRDNPFKIQTPVPVRREIILRTVADPNYCPINVSPSPLPTITIDRNSQQRNVIADLTAGTTDVLFTSSSNIPRSGEIFTFPSTNYLTYQVTASKSAVVGCSNSISYNIAYCDLTTISAPATVTQSSTINITNFFNTGSNTDVSYTASYASTTVGIPNPGSYTFDQASSTDTNVTISLKDNRIGGCNISASVLVIATPPPGTPDVEVNWIHSAEPSGGGLSIRDAITDNFIDGTAPNKISGMFNYTSGKVVNILVQAASTATPDIYLEIRRDSILFDNQTGANFLSYSLTLEAGYDWSIYSYTGVALPLQQ